jgi:hypothetical protein
LFVSIGSRGVSRVASTHYTIFKSGGVSRVASTHYTIFKSVDATPLMLLGKLLEGDHEVAFLFRGEPIGTGEPKGTF